jgi:asparagine synthase (glutamine-hydrolysing)
MRRGDDEVRVLEVPGATFAFQRHAVIAPEREITQPYRSSGYVTIANGELFGYEELRKQVRSRKISPDGTDIEVLHHHLIENGVASFADLNTMMAGAFYEEETGALTLFRDWIGEMPIHYVHSAVDGGWCFASNIAALTDATRSRLDEVREVKPGTLVRLGPAGESCEVYYDVEQSENVSTIEYQAAVSRVRDLLERSACARTHVDVPAAALLSGGTDSFVTIHLLLKYGKIEGRLPVYTFHCEDLEEAEGTDLFHARRVAAFFGDRVEHRVVTATKREVIESLPGVVRALEDTRGRDFNVFTAVYNRFLAEAISRDGIKVVYEGEGPDEALGTYSSWRGWNITDEEISRPALRKRLLSNLHKGVLLRTSKVMMEFGPIECRSFFLERELLTFFASLPVEVVRRGGRRKGVLVDAFVEELPRELLERPKARPQDSTGITAVLEALDLDYKQLLRDYLDDVREQSAQRVAREREVAMGEEC